jgi:hypothetical protein
MTANMILNRFIKLMPFGARARAAVKAAEPTRRRPACQYARAREPPRRSPPRESGKVGFSRANG